MDWRVGPPLLLVATGFALALALHAATPHGQPATGVLRAGSQPEHLAEAAVQAWAAGDFGGLQALTTPDVLAALRDKPAYRFPETTAATDGARIQLSEASSDGGLTTRLGGHVRWGDRERSLRIEVVESPRPRIVGLHWD